MSAKRLRIATPAGQLDPQLAQVCQVRTRLLFAEQHRENCAQVDQIFAALLCLQWAMGIVIAAWLSPLTWAGDQSSIHPHLRAAVLLGGVLSLGPLALTLRRQKTLLTGYVIAVAQMLFSALLIHLTGGRIETHFHIFGSLAFLAFYRERRILILAAVIIAVDHGLRGLFWPQSIFGDTATTAWRWVEHAGWVVFESVFLLISIGRSRRERYLACSRQAELEASHDIIEAAVSRRTVELATSQLRLRASEEKLRLLIDQAMDAIVTVDGNGIVGEWNPQATIMFGWSRRDMVGTLQELPPRPLVSVL